MPTVIPMLRVTINPERLQKGPLRGRVHSVFRHAVNFLMEDKRFVSLTTAPNPLAPEGMLADLKAFAPWSSPSGLLPFNAGSPVEMLQESIDAAGFRLFFKEATHVDNRASTLEDPFGLLQLISDWLPKTLSQQGAVRHLRQESLKGSERMRDIESALRRAQTDYDAPEDLRRTLQKIIGLGEGLTPSGDDFTAGIVWTACVLPRARTQLLPKLDEAVTALLHKTNDVSAQMLRFALEGRFSEPLVRLAQARQPADRLAALEAVASIGHTSGLDTLCGVRWGLKLLLSPA